jgi:nitrogen fixation-related uncharacterized protein
MGVSLRRPVCTKFKEVKAMDEATTTLTLMSLLIFLSFLGFLIWGLRSGQFKNIEEAKYKIFHNNSGGKEHSAPAVDKPIKKREDEEV